MASGRDASAARPKCRSRLPTQLPSSTVPGKPIPSFGKPGIIRTLRRRRSLLRLLPPTRYPTTILSRSRVEKSQLAVSQKYGAWFARREEPKVSTEEYEQGAYVYFDHAVTRDEYGSVRGWCQRSKPDFLFEYSHLEKRVAIMTTTRSSTTLLVCTYEKMKKRFKNSPPFYSTLFSPSIPFSKGEAFASIAIDRQNASEHSDRGPGTTHKVHFPFAPYPCQMVMMEKILFALHNGQNALLESPTGTGKTLCLLCASLAFAEERRKRKRGDWEEDDDDDDEDDDGERCFGGTPTISDGKGERRR